MCGHIKRLHSPFSTGCQLNIFTSGCETKANEREGKRKINELCFKKIHILVKNSISIILQTNMINIRLNGCAVYIHVFIFVRKNWICSADLTIKKYTEANVFCHLDKYKPLLWSHYEAFCPSEFLLHNSRGWGTFSYVYTFREWIEEILQIQNKKEANRVENDCKQTKLIEQKTN